MAQVFSFEFCVISKNTFYTEHVWWLLLKLILKALTVADLSNIEVKTPQNQF